MAQNIDVSIIPQSYLPEIKVSENDDSLRVIRVSIIDENGEAYQIPSGVTATFAGTKPSGLGFTVPCTIDGNAVQFVMEDTVCNEAGRFPAEIRLINGEARIGTCNVLMNVEPNPHPDDTTDGDREPLVNEITALLHAIEEQAEQVAEDTRIVEQAMEEWTNMSAEATTLPAGSEASASYSEGVLSLGIPAGPEGAPGQDGQDGVGIANVQLNSDYTLTITLTDGRTYTTTSIRGEQGETGLTPDFTIGTVTTLAPGSQATATITGTDDEPVLNLGIPKGDPGDVSSTGYYPDLYAGGLVTDKGETDTAPYTFRASKALGYRESLNQIVGATVGWNQLCNGSSVTVPNGHKYYMIKGGTASIGASTGTSITGLTSGTDIVTDLTAMFGTTIADYIYSLEQANAGAGVAWFKKLFPNPYYEYAPVGIESVKAGEHRTTGFNQLNYDVVRLTTAEFTIDQCTHLVGGQVYQFSFEGVNNATRWRPIIKIYDQNGNNISNDRGVLFSTSFSYYSGSGYGDGAYMYGDNITSKSWFITVYQDCYVRFGLNVGDVTSSTKAINPCIHLCWDGERNGEYEPYVKHSYPLDSSLTLRGIPKLDASNNLYYDGDTYESDGTVTRKYGVVDLGTLPWQKVDTSSGAIGYYFGLNWTDLTPLVKKTSSSTEVANIICAKYETKGSTYVYSRQDDKTIGVHNNGALVVADSAYSTAESFKAAMSGVMLVYELATPTTETADTYQQIQICDPDGTEEFVTDSIVPVGHSTFYPEDLVGKLEDIPDVPSANGTYVYKAVRTSTGVTQQWVLES